MAHTSTRGANHPQHADQTEHAEQHRAHGIDQIMGGLFTVAWGATFREDGHKGLRKRPSANRRRNKFGMRNATLKASVVALAPKAAAISNSRTRPVMRDAKVSRDTMDADFSKLIRSL